MPSRRGAAVARTVRSLSAGTSTKGLGFRRGSGPAKNSANASGGGGESRSIGETKARLERSERRPTAVGRSGLTSNCRGSKGSFTRTAMSTSFTCRPRGGFARTKKATRANGPATRVPRGPPMRWCFSRALTARSHGDIQNTQTSATNNLQTLAKGRTNSSARPSSGRTHSRAGWAVTARCGTDRGGTFWSRRGGQGTFSVCGTRRASLGGNSRST